MAFIELFMHNSEIVFKFQFYYFYVISYSVQRIIVFKIAILAVYYKQEHII